MIDRIIAIVLFTTVFVAQYAIGSELSEILQTASQIPKRLTAYQFTTSMEGDAGKTGDKAAPQVTQFSQSGSLFIVDSQTKNPTNSPLDPMIQHTMFAYNGTKYQWFMIGRDTLSFSDSCRHPNLYYFPNPMLVPYYWLITQQSNWSEIQNATHWEKRFNKAKLDGTTSIGDQTCDVVLFPDETRIYDNIYVYFAKELGYYPLRIKFAEKSAYTLIDVVKYTIRQTEEGDVVFPLEITLKVIDKGQEQVRLEWKLFPDSIRVNPTLDEDMFTISPSRAGTVVDYDEALKNIGAEGHAEMTPLQSEKWNRWRVVLVINVLFIVSIIIIMLYKNRAKQ